MRLQAFGKERVLKYILILYVGQIYDRYSANVNYHSAREVATFVFMVAHFYIFQADLLQSHWKTGYYWRYTFTTFLCFSLQLWISSDYLMV